MVSRALGSTQQLTGANTKPINVRNLLTEQMLRPWGLQSESLNIKSGLTLAAGPQVQDKTQRPRRSHLSQLDVARRQPGNGVRSSGLPRSCREGEKHGFKPSLCLGGCVIFSKTADLCESTSSLKIKTVKTVAAATSQSCED